MQSSSAGINDMYDCNSGRNGHVYSKRGGSNLGSGGSKSLMDPSILIDAATTQQALLGAGGYLLGQMMNGQGVGGANGVISTDLDSIVQIQKRKLQRRQANRKSAQLSRARKKAHLEELKEENLRLQHMADILDSQAEFIFSFTPNGQVTHIPDRMQSLIRSAADDPDEDITNVRQILTSESVDILMESLKEINTENNPSSSQSVTFVKEVYYHDATGFPVAGFMRCSRLQRRRRCKSKSEEDINAASGSDSEEHSPSIRKRGVPNRTKLDTTLAGDLPYSGDDEYVCVIRPASTSTPHCLNNLHLLSAASMVAHDSVTIRSPRDGEALKFERRGSSSPSDGSNSSGLPHSSLTTDQTKNSTSSSEDRSSEDRSEDNASAPSTNSEYNDQ